MADAVVYRHNVISFFKNEPFHRFARAMASLRRLAVAIVPKGLIEEFYAIYREGYGTADVLVEILLKREIELNERTAFSMLLNLAGEDANAAFHCAQGYIGYGRYRQDRDGTRSLYYFKHSAILGHPQGFLMILRLICDDLCTISGTEFVKICREVITKTQNYNVAIFIGTLLCGIPIQNHHELERLKLYDPNVGYNFLRFVLGRGDDYQKVEALNVITTGFKNNIFTSPPALAFKQELIEKEIWDPVLGPRV